MLCLVVNSSVDTVVDAIIRNMMTSNVHFIPMFIHNEHTQIMNIVCDTNHMTLLIWPWRRNTMYMQVLCGCTKPRPYMSYWGWCSASTSGGNQDATYTTGVSNNGWHCKRCHHPIYNHKPTIFQRLSAKISRFFMWHKSHDPFNLTILERVAIERYGGYATSGSDFAYLRITFPSLPTRARARPLFARIRAVIRARARKETNIARALYAW